MLKQISLRTKNARNVASRILEKNMTIGMNIYYSLDTGPAYSFLLLLELPNGFYIAILYIIFNVKCYQTVLFPIKLIAALFTRTSLYTNHIVSAKKDTSKLGKLRNI